MVESGFNVVFWFRLINYNMHKATTKLFLELPRHCHVCRLLLIIEQQKYIKS